MIKNIELLKKQILPISILLGFIILGTFIYKGITEKQNSINIQEEKEYIGKRRMECYEILERERNIEKEQHTSVVGVEYINNPLDKTFNDTCRIEYKYLILNQDGTTSVETDYKSY